ncbi:TPA: ead/Ea22-like family protein [Escherichia coli]|nr:ead/Ea22-like family protein [Escherichia coli]ELY7430306.1 ead/Ea22-like family protein [Escherichia coli]
MSNIDKQALRADALEATGGSWVRESGEGWEAICCDDDQGNAGFIIAEFQGENATANRKFVQSANPATVLALLDELEAKDSSISTQQHEIRTLLNALEQATEKRNSDIPGQKRLIGWRASDYTDETSDPELAKNWAAAIGVLPIFEGDVNTKLSAAGIKGE